MPAYIEVTQIENPTCGQGDACDGARGCSYCAAIRSAKKTYKAIDGGPL